MKRYLNPITGEYVTATKEQVYYHLRRNFEAVINYLIEATNGYLTCIPCGIKSPEFRSLSGLVQHFRFNKQHIIDYMVEYLEENQNE